MDGGGRISIESARALLAKTYLAAAWDLDKKDYFAKAAQVADDVIANRALVTPFEDLWRADCSGDDNEEFIWDVEYDYATAANTVSGGHPWSSFYCNHMGGKKIMERGVLLLLLRLYMLCSVLKRRYTLWGNVYEGVT